MPERKYYQIVAQSKAIPERENVNQNYKWDLTDIFGSDDEWEKSFNLVSNQLEDYKKFEGKLSENSESLLSCIKFDEKINITLDRLQLYTMLSKDSDMRIGKYQSMDERVKSLYAKVGAESAFLRPELLQIPDRKLLEMIESNEELKIYKHSINDLLRSKKHTLSNPEEKILAMSSEISQTPYNAFSIFTNADLKLPMVIDEQGELTELSHGRYYSALYSKNRDYRERVFKAYLGSYKNFINTFTVLFNGNLKTNIFNARARNFNSALEAALHRNNIPVSVYHNLIESANKNLQPMYRWASLKKKLLGLDKLKPYDVYVTIFNSENEKKYEYGEGINIVRNSLQIMGDDYLSSLDKAFSNRWIDVFETKSKRSGAYSSGTTFGVHPYVLLNWTDLLNDVFTLTHEMGHNMHSYYTGESQPYPYANYSIFLAEVASTFNESLLLDHLLEIAETRDEKLFLLERYLNNLTATFYRQVMFAEFEMIVYKKTEMGESLTADVLNEMYSSMYQKYWGPDMHVADEEQFTWARIPHFYYNFYVYQYATGFAASEVLAKKVKTEGVTAVNKYLDFLKAGSSDYPINILTKAGVDMNSHEPVQAVSDRMNQVLNEMEDLL
ncbi:MAG: Oligoendopeptidase F, plasmid [Ignavibacteriaceae bacterium]|nr:Oligoendopeptidase F, plasmid [Ignavibacteriaceae bacterium]